MKIKVEVGGIKISTQGIELTKRDINKLLESAGSIALAMLDAADPGDDETEPVGPPMGFSAHLELAPDLPIEDYFTDDEE